MRFVAVKAITRVMVRALSVILRLIAIQAPRISNRTPAARRRLRIKGQACPKREEMCTLSVNLQSSSIIPARNSITCLFRVWKGYIISHGEALKKFLMILLNSAAFSIWGTWDVSFTISNFTFFPISPCKSLAISRGNTWSLSPHTNKTSC